MDSGHTVAFGTLLRRARRAAGLTQEEVAERAGVSARTVSDLERGVSHTPHTDTVALLAEALGLQDTDRGGFVGAAGRLRAPASLAPRRSVAPAAGDGAQAPFVGRQRELALLDRHLAGQGPPVLLLAGEPGIGKTRLLHAAIPRAVAQGWRVLEGGCQRRGGHEPFAPILGALQRHVRGQVPDDLRVQLQGCAWLVRLLPELADGPVEPLPAWTVTAEHEPRLMAAAVTRFLTNVAGPAGTLLIVDDLQWAGADALDLLATLVRSATDVPLRIVGAYRSTEVEASHPLSDTLSDLAHAGLAARRLLTPLAPQEAEQLLEGLLEATVVAATLRERVLQRTGGVPFFLVSCAQELRLADADAGGMDAVPWDVAHSVRQRVAALPETAREVLGVAALMGRMVDPSLLTAVAMHPEHEVLRAIEVASRVGLLVEERDAHQFAHDVIREVMEEDVGAARRTLVHRRVGRALEQQPGAAPVEALAYHYARSGDQEKALLYLERAGDHARRQGAHTAAVTCYGDLIDHLERLGRALDAARACEKLVTVLLYLGRMEAAAAAAAEHAATAYRAAGDVEGLRRALALIGALHAWQGAPAEGLARLQPLMEELTQGARTAGMAALYGALAWLFLAGGEQQECELAAERAADLARAVGDDYVLADVEVRRGAALIDLGRAEEARRALEDVLPLAQTVGDPGPLVRLYNQLAGYYLRRGTFDQSRRYFDRAIEIDQQNGEMHNLSWALCGLGEILFYHGEWEAARAHFERAAAMMRSAEWCLLSHIPLVWLARFHLATGEWAQTSQCLEEAVANARSHTQRGLWPTVPLLLAEQDLLDGRPQAALGRLLLLRDNPKLAEGANHTLLPLLAWAHLSTGDDVMAAVVAARGIQCATERNDRLAMVEALRVNGMVMVRQHRWTEAASSLDEGLAITRNLPYPYAEARLLHVYGMLHARQGEPGPAQDQLGAALAIFQQLGAHKDVGRIEQDIAGLQQ